MLCHQIRQRAAQLVHWRHHLRDVGQLYLADTEPGVAEAADFHITVDPPARRWDRVGQPRAKQALRQRVDWLAAALRKPGRDVTIALRRRRRTKLDGVGEHRSQHDPRECRSEWRLD